MSSSGSVVSNIPLWGQAWELLVTYATESGEPQLVKVTSNTWEPDALRMTFDVLQAMNSSPFWYADINVYNMTTQDAKNTLANATWVTLRAGFQTGPNLYSTIWDGPVFQTIITKEGVVDYKVTLHCVANPFIMDSIVNFNTGPFNTQLQLLERMADEVGLPPMTFGQGTISKKASNTMSVQQYPRGRGVFGKVGKYIAQLADSNFMQSWRDGQQAYISEIGDGTNVTPKYVYSPPFPPNYSPQQLGLPPNTTSSIIDTPQQTQEGVIFTVLLDPRLSVQLPPLVVQLVRTQITQLVRTPTPASSGGNYPTSLNANLTFFVAQVHHTGDTRGNQWQTEVTGYSTTYGDNLVNGVFSPNAIGGQ